MSAIVVYYEDKIFVSTSECNGEAFDEVVGELGLDPILVGWDEDSCNPTYDGAVVPTYYCDELTQVK